LLDFFPAASEIYFFDGELTKIRLCALFSKYSNLCDHGTWTLRTDRQTDRRTTYCGSVASPPDANLRCIAR